ncbi:MAG: helix-turn-helix domain-containing protein [Pseudomonadota bacterium]
MSSHKNTTSDILDRLKSVAGIKLDIDLATKLGIGQSTLANWKSRSSLDHALIISFCEDRGISTDWVFFDKGEPSGSDAGYHPSTPVLGINIDVLIQIIERIEAWLQRERLSPPIEKKARLIALMYAYFTETESDVTEEKVREYLKLVA